MQFETDPRWPHETVGDAVGRTPRTVCICARVDRHGLIGAECRALAGGVPGADGVAVVERIDRVGRAAYVQQGLEVVAAAGSFDDLVAAVAERSFDAHRFRIDLHDPAGRSSLGSTSVAVALADVIEFGPDLDDPLHRFVAIPTDGGGWLLAEEVTATDAGYRRHDAKPWTTSSSLDSRFARALVNLVPDARSVLDPCCGAGSIVLEAASLGLEAHAADRQPAMVGMTNENLARFGYEASVNRCDSCVADLPIVDAVVTDLPYGHAIDADEDTIRRILWNCARSAGRGVFVAPADFSLWLEAAGWCDVEVTTVLKRRGFTRWIHTARSGVVE